MSEDCGDEVGPAKESLMGLDVTYCDECGEQVGTDAVWYAKVPVPVASASAGESAVLCGACASEVACGLL